MTTMLPLLFKYAYLTIYRAPFIAENNQMNATINNETSMDKH